MAPQPDSAYSASASPPAMTQPVDFELRKRQAGGSPNFIGYILSAGQWVPEYCSGTGVYVETHPFSANLPGYGACCLTPNGCVLPTACNGVSLVYPSNQFTFVWHDIIPLPSRQVRINNYCQVPRRIHVILLEFCPNLNNIDGALMYGCGTASEVYLRTPPGTAHITTTPSLVLPTSEITGSGNSGLGGSTPTSTSTTSTTSSASGPASSNNHSNGNPGATIAGAGIGPVAAVALILGLAYIFFRRRHNDGTTGTAPQNMPPQTYWHDQVPGVTWEHKAELPANPTRHPTGMPPVYTGVEGNTYPVVTTTPSPRARGVELNELPELR